MWNLVQRLMGGDPDAPRDVIDPRFPKPWSVLALFYSTVYADGRVQAEEDLEVDALITRTRTFMPVSQDEVDRYVAELHAHREGANSMLGLADLAIENLPDEPGLPLAIFAHCVDLVHADRLVERSEQEFIDHIAEALRLTRQQYDDVIQVMEWKHEVMSEEAEGPDENDPSQPWSRRRCMFVLYYAAALSDNRVTYDEAVALSALVFRAKSLVNLSESLAEDIRDEVVRAAQKGQMKLFVEQALRDFPKDERHALAVYANCADIVRADRRILAAERRFMDLLARELSITRRQRTMIDEVMDAKYRH